MYGALTLVVVLVVILPVVVLMSCAILAAVLGSLIKRDVDLSHEGSELIATNI